MKNSSHIFVFFTLFLTLFTSAGGQKLSDSELQTFLAKATEKTSEYSDVFKNLTAEEVKTFEIFDEEGNLKSQKKVLSDLIIYEPENNKGNIGEFHNVRSVDGKKVNDGDKRALKVFAKLADAKSFAEELEKLNKESSRFDKGLKFYGLTSTQAVPLASNLISSFKFEEIGRESIEGREIIIVKFQQIAENPGINLKVEAPDYLEISNKFYRGTIWLDLNSYRVLKFISEFVIDSAKFTEPLVLIKEEYFYQPSDFGIYLPRKIIVENFSPQISKQKQLLKTDKLKLTPGLQTRLSMEYKNYSKFDIKVKSN